MPSNPHWIRDPEKLQEHMEWMRKRKLYGHYIKKRLKEYIASTNPKSPEDVENLHIPSIIIYKAVGLEPEKTDYAFKIVPQVKKEFIARMRGGWKEERRVAKENDPAKVLEDQWKKDKEEYIKLGVKRTRMYNRPSKGFGFD